MRFTSLFEKMITNEMITISNLSNISFQKWNDIDFGLVLRDSSGKGVQLVVNRIADSGNITINAYAV